MLQERRLFGTISPGILDNEVSILFKATPHKDEAVEKITKKW